MIILDSNQAERKYKLKQIVKYILLSLFCLLACFLLGIVIYEINFSQDKTEFEESGFVEEKILQEEQIDFEGTDFEAPQAKTEPEPQPQINTEPPADWQNSEGAKLFYQKLAEIEAAAKQAQEKNKEDALSEMPQEELDKIYEEKLPEDVIIDEIDEEELTPEQQAAGYHIYNRHTDVKTLNIIPKYKPAYFGKEPVIAIVIDDMGIAKKRTADIISLQAPITASFLTYGKEMDKQVEAAQKAGMEIMLHVPMEPYSKADIAPDVLTTQMSSEEIKQRLEEMILKFPNVKGINNHMGSKFTEDEKRMSAVMEVLQEKNIFFLDSKTTPKSVGKKTAQAKGVSYATRHVFIDNENKVEYILKQLSLAEKIAKRNGYAVAIGHPKSGTYLALKEWIPSLKDKKIKILPLSDIVKVLHKSHI